MSKDKTNSFYASCEEKLKHWVQVSDDIRAAFVIGSRARSDHPADDWSDMDIVLYAHNSNYYLNNIGWIKPFGNVISSLSYISVGNDPVRLTLFEGGWQVDFVIHPYEVLREMVSKKTIPSYFFRGVRVLADKEQVSSNILPKKFTVPSYKSISEERFSNTVQMFWFGAMYVAKQIRRNELWVVKMRDIELKNLLLQMIEWHEKALNGNEYDTWHAGRFISEWVNPKTYQELSNTFGHFDKTDSWDALLVSISLFKRLSQEISEKLSFNYSRELESYVYSWIQAIMLS